MQRFQISSVFVVVVVSTLTANARDRGIPQPVSGQPGCPPTQAVEYTVMVPKYVTEKRKELCTEYRNDVQERTVTYYEHVPKTEQRTCTYTEYEYERRTRNEAYTVCKPVWKEKTENYTIEVPHVEKRTGTRTVCECVAVKKKKTIRDDQGCWQRVGNPCDSSSAATHRRLPVSTVSYSGHGYGTRCAVWEAPCYRPPVCGCRGGWTWVPKIVEREIEYTDYELRRSEEPYEYEVTVCKPETRTHTVRYCEWEKQQLSRTVEYCVCVPKERTRVYDVTTYECVAKEKVEQYTVCVPYTVEREFEVQVCKMVPQTVKCPVHEDPCDDPCDYQPRCGHRRRGLFGGGLFGLFGRRCD